MQATLRFSASKVAGSKMIAWFTWADFSHVEVVFSTHTIGSRFVGGVQEWPLGSKYRHVKDVRIDVSQAFFDFLEAQLGRKYDYLSILGFIFRRDWQEKRRWHCSELIASALVADNRLTLANLNRVTPGMLYALIQNSRFVRN